MLVSVGADGPPPSFFNCSSQPEGAFTPVVLKNSKGMEATMIPYGATITHLVVPDAWGGMRDVLLGWDDAIQYCSNPSHTYFGATIGRIANRIAGCSFELDGQLYNLSCNEKDYDTLHGGVVGWDRQVWTLLHQNSSSVTWRYSSLDGEMGFPGDVLVLVTHTITEDNEWSIKYEAAAGDKPTVVAMTNHAYFNLNANVANTPTVVEHVLEIPRGTQALDVTGAPDYHLIPTGKVSSIAPGSPMDFTKPKRLGNDIDEGIVTAIGGYDNAWIFDPAPTKVEHVVTLSSPLTGIKLEMSTDQPSVQIYTGNFLNGTGDTAIQRKASQSYGNKMQYYHYRGAITLEAQGYPDAVHHDNFPSVRLDAGGHYEQTTIYKFSTSDAFAVTV